MDDIVTRLRIGWEAMGDMANAERAEAADEIEMLRAERDELRREVCCAETPGETQGAALLYAKSRGWDCFKENTNV
jgi:hypothetical protein